MRGLILLTGLVVVGCSNTAPRPEPNALSVPAPVGSNLGGRGIRRDIPPRSNRAKRLAAAKISI